MTLGFGGNIYFTGVGYFTGEVILIGSGSGFGSLTASTGSCSLYNFLFFIF